VLEDGSRGLEGGWSHSRVPVRGVCLRCQSPGLNTRRPPFPWPRAVLPVVSFFSFGIAIKVVCWWLHLALDTAASGHDILYVVAVSFLVVIVIVVNRGCNSLRVALSPLLVVLVVLLGALDGDAGWHCSAAINHCFPTVGDSERPDHLHVGGVLGGNAEQLLTGVPDDVIRCPKARRLLCIMHAAPGRLWPWSLRVMVVSFLVIVSTSMWVLRAQVPVASLTVCLGFCTLALLPWWALG
jgi:hypothetical protein